MGGPVAKIFGKKKPQAAPAPAPAPVAAPAPPPEPPAPAPAPEPEPVVKKQDEERILGRGKAYSGRARRRRSVLGDPATVEKKTLLGG